MLRRTQHEELTDAENERLLATLTPPSWRGLTVELIAARYWREIVYVNRDSQKWHPDIPWKEEEVNGISALMEMDSPLELVIHEARQSSGSIGGEHRRDLKEAIIGAPQSQPGLSVAVSNQQTQPPPGEKKGAFNR